MKKKPYQTKENTDSCVEEAAVAYGLNTNDVNNRVSIGLQSLDPEILKSERMTVSEYFDEIRTALRKKYENKIVICHETSVL